MLQNKISITTDEAKALIYVLNRPDNTHSIYRGLITWLEENVITGQKFVYRFADLPYELKSPWVFNRCEHCGWDSDYSCETIKQERIHAAQQTHSARAQILSRFDAHLDRIITSMDP